MRAHSETALRSFYDFHLDVDTGPLINPFPLDRSGRRRRAHAGRDPTDPPRKERSGLYRPTVPVRVPRSVPDEVFNEIFARLPSHRDRALVAFYVSTGARASELLSATCTGTAPGRQLITVVRKGDRELQELPASTDAFVWLRLYQMEMADEIPRGGRQPLATALASQRRRGARLQLAGRADAMAGNPRPTFQMVAVRTLRRPEDPDLRGHHPPFAGLTGLRPGERWPSQAHSSNRVIGSFAL